MSVCVSYFSWTESCNFSFSVNNFWVTVELESHDKAQVRNSHGIGLVCFETRRTDFIGIILMDTRKISKIISNYSYECSWCIFVLVFELAYSKRNFWRYVFSWWSKSAVNPNMIDNTKLAYGLKVLLLKSIVNWNSVVNLREIKKKVFYGNVCIWID